MPSFTNCLPRTDGALPDFDETLGRDTAPIRASSHLLVRFARGAGYVTTGHFLYRGV